MPVFFILFDLSIVMAALVSGLFWWQASQRGLRRVSREEILDHADFNRLVVAFNRSRVLNARAAIATAAASILAAMRLGANLIFGTGL
ncbi:hypothetical protein T8S45_05655 [Blastomonas marina]|uniref:hypothetical protein n=1 Tax=Blastomonas marina TaxID=1867408 RepID=UPI002AC91CF9|nr:hypothetical protein [Blastomonas marina]WPZ05022.1 hypothetical protein T8S45_05655 [Blastomonas marina]